jgi:CheY-like chemotaxis protein
MRPTAFPIVAIGASAGGLEAVSELLAAAVLAANVGVLGIAKDFRPDTALIDIGLPGMDGYELAHRLRQEFDGQGLQLVAMTGYGRTEDREAAHAAGFDVHVVKPADLDELRRMLAHGRMRPEN